MSSLSPFDFVSYDLFRWFLDEYFSTGPFFQLIVLQFVCKRLRDEMFNSRSRCKARLEDLRNTAPKYRKSVLLHIGSEACQYLPVVRWLRDQLHFEPNVEWCLEAIRCKSS